MKVGILYTVGDVAYTERYILAYLLISLDEEEEQQKVRRSVKLRNGPTFRRNKVNFF